MKIFSLTRLVSVALACCALGFLYGADLSSDIVDATRLEADRISGSETTPGSIALHTDAVFGDGIAVRDGGTFLGGVSFLPPSGDVPMGCFTNISSTVGGATNSPSWWSEYGVFGTNAPNDFAAVTQGQVKWLAACASCMLETEIPTEGGAGEDVRALVGSLSSTNNFLAITVGQLKNTAGPFWSRLHELGIATNGWAAGASVDDFAMANIGQAKYLFSIDFGPDSDSDGILDWWETYYGLNPQNAADATDDADDDGVTNIEEYMRGTVPDDSADRNRVLYADSDVGGSGYDGFSHVVVTALHGPKATAQQAMDASVSGDVIELRGETSFGDAVLSPGEKNLFIRPVGEVKF